MSSDLQQKKCGIKTTESQTLAYTAVGRHAETRVIVTQQCLILKLFFKQSYRIWLEI